MRLQQSVILPKLVCAKYPLFVTVPLLQLSKKTENLKREFCTKKNITLELISLSVYRGPLF